MTHAAASPVNSRREPHVRPDEHRHHVPVPRAAIIAIGLLLAATVVLVAISQWTGLGQARAITIEADNRFELVFADGANGTIEVRNPQTGEAIHAFAGDGAIGFVRVALRALIFDRQNAGIGPEAPFHLLTTAGGQAYLSDPATGQFVALNAFGGDNGTQFAPLVDAARRAGLASQPGTVTLGGGAS